MPDDKENKDKRATEIQKAVEAADARKRADEDAVGVKLDKLLEFLDSVSSRLDAIENKSRDSGDGGEMKEPDEPQKVVADSASLGEIQARFDQLAAEFGERAGPPMIGETPRNYRLRLLRRFQKHSREFKERIFADSIAAAATPEVPEGRLVERRRTVGHGIVMYEFFGKPSAWMRQFSGQRRLVKSIRRDWK
jgi:hypothetical protein